MSTYYTILTNRGKSKLSTCIAQGTSLPLSKIAVGEGLNGATYAPTGDQASLKSEVHRDFINAIYRDLANPAWIVAEMVIPADIGGWYTREGGVYDTDGELFAIGLLPESYKPAMTSGAAKTQTIRLIMNVGADAQVTLAVSNADVFITQAGLTAQINALTASLVTKKDFDALKASIYYKSDFAYSFAANGYCMLPGGYIRQWGQSYADAATGYVDVTYPIAFTTVVLARGGIPHQATTDNIQRTVAWASDVYIGSLTKTRFLMRKDGSRKSDGYFTWEVTGK